jgi:hypothetical protein
VKLYLPDVTLVAIDTICHELTALAVKECLDKAQFGAIQICTDNRLPFQDADIDSDIIAVSPFASLDEVMNYLWYRVPEHIQTSHALIVQWDSGITSHARWSERFLQYDYVGAPWGWHGDQYEVGNGGFSLRSLRLMRYMAERKQDFPLGHPEDDLLCRHYRPDLERDGFRWAPNALALQFAFERTGFSGTGRHFGYHGVFNWPRVFSTAALHERTLLMLKNKYLNQPKHLTELLHAVTHQQALNARTAT